MSEITVSDVIAVVGTLVSLLGILTRRYWPAQKRIGWRAQLNLPIPMIPEEARGHVELRLLHMGREVPDASIALLRVENAGSSTISREDIQDPLTFVFEGRTILAVEVPETSEPAIANMLTRNRGLSDFAEGRVRLPRVPLNRRDHFKLLVLLTGSGTGVGLHGFISGGRITEGHWRRRTQAFTIGLVVLLTASLTLLGASFAIGSDETPSDLCVAGELSIDGSTAFQPILEDIRDAYVEECRGTDVDVTIAASGSLEAVRDLVASEARDRIAVSDGRTTTPDPNLIQNPVGVVIFSVVVNRETGVHSLTTDELRRIYAGDITNWLELGGNDHPIQIVSRGSESGTRRVFQDRVLGTTEPALTSDNCATPLINSSGPVIRCERDSTTELLTEVDRLPGAIGYAETSAVAALPNVIGVQLDNAVADIEPVMREAYHYWTVELFYTYGQPPTDSLAGAFLRYLQEDTAKNILRSYGHVPCVDRQNLLETLCA
ncbi:PstS family phosphate ABC transporter substrate-binding protein [Streptomyces hainanensis]|uniref:Phosphate-binding protein n=1 Tax=Streptomyces hainanensis TaxID=402648 RepID=A0A4R4TI46_9ACTN|nr:substrate-binding domain-containing protein [Streptomyces hainanensis]TDC74922.1 phosphate-binding protein [Streptomyces hainanensis]